MSKQRWEFGSYAGVDGLRALLYEQSLIVNEIAQQLNNPATLPSRTLLVALSEDLEAYGHLGQVLLVNQMLLLSRVVLERAVLAIYLLWNRDSGLLAPHNNDYDEIEGGQPTLANAVDTFRRTAWQYRGELTVDAKTLPTIWEQIDILENYHPRETIAFRMGGTSIWQKSQWIWDGKIEGAICHRAPLKNEETDTHHLGQETTTLLYQTICLVDAVAACFATWQKHQDGVEKSIASIKVDELASRADQNSMRASELIGQLIRQGTSPSTKYADGIWNRLSFHEQMTTPKLDRILRDWEPYIASCYELGVTAPTLSTQLPREDNFRVAALFLKRALTDLRVVWKTVINGYSQQAASIAAGLFEHTLLVSALASSPKRTRQLLHDPSGRPPWDIRCLCGFEVENEYKVDKGVRGKVNQQSQEFKASVSSLYALYQMLCNEKHPTMGSALHLSGSTKSEGRYVVMALPDVRDEDLPLKISVLSISLSRCHSAITQFADAMECDADNPEVIIFREKLAELWTGLCDLVTSSKHS